MRHFLFALFFSLVLCPAIYADDQLQTGVIIHRKYKMKEVEREIPYTLYLPKNYDGTKETPVLFALHGLFSDCYQIIRYPGIVPAAEKNNFILVAPMGYNNQGWYGMYGKEKRGDKPKNLGELSERDVINVMTMIRKEFNVDAQRIYLYGHSMGGGGCFHFLSKYPNQFAAIATVAPAFFVADRGQRLKDNNSPIMIIQGTKDILVNINATRSLVKEIKHPEKKVDYIEVEGAGHLKPAWSYWNEIFSFYHAAKLRKKAPLPVFK